MKLVLIIALAFSAAANCFAQQSPGKVGMSVPVAYELYSWQATNGGWNFYIAPSPSGVNISAKQIFDRRFRLSVEQLGRKISRLPEGATVYWLDHVTSRDSGETKAAARLRYPRSDEVQEIKRIAEAHSIKIEMH